MGGWMEGKAGLRIAYSNKKNLEKIMKRPQSSKELLAQKWLLNQMKFKFLVASLKMRLKNTHVIWQYEKCY
jgi:hypothetical protein